MISFRGRQPMLCEFADQFPIIVADFLQSGRSLRRGFREESVTDLIMGGLVSLGRGKIIVEFPNERVTGADMEWNFVNQRHRTFFRLRIQAKQLSGYGGLWGRHCYKGLLYCPGKSNKLQATLLCNSARRGQVATYPLYTFYHPARSCMLAQRVGIEIEGINLADGYAIEQLAKSATNRRLRTRNKSLSTIHPLLFSLSDLFCPSSAASMPPTPGEVRERLVNSRLRLYPDRQVIVDHFGDLLADLPEVPPIAETIPDDVRAIMARASSKSDDGEHSPLRRWRVTFVSDYP